MEDFKSRLKSMNRDSVRSMGKLTIALIAIMTCFGFYVIGNIGLFATNVGLIEPLPSFTPFATNTPTATQVFQNMSSADACPFPEKSRLHDPKQNIHVNQTVQIDPKSPMLQCMQAFKIGADITGGIYYAIPKDSDYGLVVLSGNKDHNADVLARIQKGEPVTIKHDQTTFVGAFVGDGKTLNFSTATPFKELKTATLTPTTTPTVTLTPTTQPTVIPTPTTSSSPDNSVYYWVGGGIALFLTAATAILMHGKSTNAKKTVDASPEGNITRIILGYTDRLKTELLYRQLKNAGHDERLKIESQIEAIVSKYL